MKRFLIMLVFVSLSLTSCEEYRARQEQQKKILDSFTIINNQLKAAYDSLGMDTIKLK